MPRRKRKRRRLGESTVPAERLRAERPGHVWAFDFQFDQPATSVLKVNAKHQAPVHDPSRVLMGTLTPALTWGLLGLIGSGWLRLVIWAVVGGICGGLYTYYARHLAGKDIPQIELVIDTDANRRRHFTDPKSGVAAFSVVVGRVNSWRSRVTRAHMAAIGWIATSRSPIDRERLLNGSLIA